jgi:predicted PurR-regulated permease PerM
MYRDGALKLFPERVRPKAAEISRDIEFVLRWWLFGQLIPMAVLGAVSMIGLKLLGVPLAFTLGLLTALMLFLPYVGSVAAYLPTVLLALTKGPHTALWVTVLYLAVHLGEGYVLTPMVQRRAVKLAPALTLAAQLLLFEFAGVLGLLAATPLAAVARALVQKLYLREPA